MKFFGSNVLYVSLFEYVLMDNQEVEIRPQIINSNSTEPLFYPFGVKIDTCSSSFNNINDAYAKLYVPDITKNKNVKAFDLMLRTNETRHIKRHETQECKCGLDASVSNNTHRWNYDKCRCLCEESIDKGICNKDFIWNDNNCDCECDKSCDVGEYLDYKNCICRKRLIDS